MLYRWIFHKQFVDAPKEKSEETVPNGHPAPVLSRTTITQPRSDPTARPHLEELVAFDDQRVS
jgi:hypothetical protein